MVPKCPIVGIGASAGGLGALKSFFDKASTDMGAAFVIIQHLDPNHQSLTAEILGRHTTMPAQQIERGMKVEKNHVYVIPPNTYLTLNGNEFELGEAVLRHSLRMPIDVFFSSLAKEHTQHAVGIVLSGTGSDGTAGIRDIKASGGITFAQSPETAQFDGMPRAAIATGQVDIVCSVEDMPAHISEYLAHGYADQVSNAETALATPDDEANLKSIIALLHARLGHDFRGYKKGTLKRRIARRMGLRNIQKLSDYLTYLREQEGEARELYRDLLISVTSFFRDPEAYRALETIVLAKLVAEKGSDEPIRVWVPGCATGEEAYSIAILLIEKLDAANKRCPIQIFATDLDEPALTIGRTGIYSAGLLAEMSPERLDRFFIKNDGSYRVNKELRESVTFASQNVITDPPFSKLDLVSCRNLLIYLDGNLQDKIIGYFHFALREEGFLFLGRSESINQLAGLFDPVDKKARIFRRLANSRANVASFPINAVTSRTISNGIPPATRPKETVRMRELMQQQLLRSYAPAAVLTNAKHQVLYFMGPTARYLEQPSGLPTQNLINLVRAELRKDVRIGIKRAIETSESVIIENSSVQHGTDHKQTKISIKPVLAPGEVEPLFLVTFEDIVAEKANRTSTAAPLGAEAREAMVGELESKLRDAQEDLQISVEELESTNEELQASNEEMMSVNEELQSANEEMETSKEELQAMNEELSTVNNQLKDKVEQLAELNDDLENFVASTEIATLLLDSKHQIGRFTPSAKRLFNLIDTDLGRPIGDIRQKFADENFLQDVDGVFEKFQPVEREIVAEDGSSYLMRIAPYRSSEQRQGGVVVTFVDISRRLENERKLRKSEARFRNLVENAPDPLIMADAAGNIVLANAEAEHFFGYGKQELLGKNVEELIPRKQRARHKTHRKKYMRDPQIRPIGSNLNLQALLRDGTEVPVEISLSPVETDDGIMVCAAIRDERDHQKAVVAVREAQSKAEMALAAKSRFLATASHDLRQPLQSLAMLTEALLLKIEDSELVDLVERQSVSLGNMRSLLNSLLDISKLDADAVKVEIEDVELLKIIENVCLGFQAEAEEKGLTLLVEVQNRVVRSDRNLLQQILQNLIGNAIRYTKKGNIKVISAIVGDNIRIEVEDTGVGIAKDQLSHIFDEFYQIGRDPQEGNVGLGLGLAISCRIAEKLDSRIEVQSKVGMGSTFSFMLPLIQTLLPEKQTRQTKKPLPLQEDKAVLLVDDDPAVLKSTRFRLSLQKGLEIFTASSPQEADEMLERMAPRKPDIIVTDYHLGTEKNGIDVIRDIRMRTGASIPAILLSGDTAIDVTELECDDINVVFKPSHGNELIDGILRLLSS
tara:strand:- start:2290 stop:6324 length:4035 start_codon:yes stop_codon:yes gene_type:complete